ncbi:hypothetical protein SAE02_74650 [Skermanella aerolata]|uniref:HTH DNA binding domain-containing protein n=1 Tax=Skermanella aerolata TaxID=393310 RepID=A0A512E3P7_9PROT|nr:hypothetical protein [Skermanella aerolata]KJB90382.1 hypothetical protein N826_41445 [Skermanella aerolata KACC 11604]GEO43317.1 hypothetical protein SAE02_74650 [Skermanella aerolata]
MADLFVAGGIVTALEQAAIAIGRLDTALVGNPLRRAWTFWSELDAARRHAEADGRKVDLFRLAAHLHGLPLRPGDTTSAPERGREIAGLNHAVELRSWMATPDPEQQYLRDIALDSLRDCGGGQPALVATAHGMLAWLAGQGSRPAIRAAVPLYLRDRAITIHALAAVTGSDALRAGPDDPDGFTVRFLDAVRREAADGRGRLLTMEREWRGARLRVDHRAGARSNSGLPAAVDLLAASPLLSISALAEALNCSVEGASRMLDALVQLEVAAEVTGRTERGARRLYGLRRLLPIRAETTAVRRRTRGGQRGRPKRVLTAPFAELADEPKAAAVTPDAEPGEPARLAAVSFDFDALDRLIAAADERTRGVRRLLDRIARSEKPFPATDKTEEA